MGHKEVVPLGRLKNYQERESKPESWFIHPFIRAIFLTNYSILFPVLFAASGALALTVVLRNGAQ